MGKTGGFLAFRYWLSAITRTPFENRFFIDELLVGSR